MLIETSSLRHASNPVNVFCLSCVIIKKSCLILSYDVKSDVFRRSRVQLTVDEDHPPLPRCFLTSVEPPQRWGPGAFNSVRYSHK